MRDISIELGFAYTTLGDDAAEPAGFIDLPGHGKFAQTMIAGASVSISACWWSRPKRRSLEARTFGVPRPT